MPNKKANVLILIGLWVVTSAIGTYVTFFRQPQELARSSEAEEGLSIERAELRDLATTEGRMRQEIQFAAQRWQARYKNVNDSLTTADVAAYVNRFAQSDFRTLNIEFAGLHTGSNHSYYIFDLSGSGPFPHVHEFVWHMENNRDLYRVENLSVERLPDMETTDVQFSFRLFAYFSVPGAASAPDTTYWSEAFAGDIDDYRPLVPDDVLPARRPRVDPFAFSRTRIDHENAVGTIASEQSHPPLPTLTGATLVSIAGGIAVFNSGGAQTRVRVGDLVREGEVTGVDAARSRVVVRSGTDIVHTFEMDLPPLYRRSMGSTVIVPVG